MAEPCACLQRNSQCPSRHNIPPGVSRRQRGILGGQPDVFVVSRHCRQTLSPHQTLPLLRLWSLVLGRPRPALRRRATPHVSHRRRQQQRLTVMMAQGRPHSRRTSPSRETPKVMIQLASQRPRAQGPALGQ